MFSKSKINDPIDPSAPTPEKTPLATPKPAPQAAAAPAAKAGPKPAPSIISSDLKITGNLETTGDMQIEGQIEGDIRSHLLTIGQNATVRGEIVADDVVVNGKVIGRIRGLKIRLASTARVEGDILHKNIAIESGAQFEGSVQRSDDPISQDAPVRKLAAPTYGAAAAAES
ncbi:MAG: polymer-forming cytoskeletal protein [Pseudomonadota bacterium]